MKILVFSDSHLYLPFDEKKFQFLKKIITSADRVIVNGDFYDSYMIDFDRFVASPWKQLFPYLLQKKAVYIYGNHDKRAYSSRDVDLFSVIQAERYKIKTASKTFIFEHGHKIRVTPDTKWKVEEAARIVVPIAHVIRQIMVSIFGKAFLWARFSYRNANAKKVIKEKYHPGSNEMYIIGHNHWGEVDEKNHFAASGAVLYGFAQYLTVENDKVTLHEYWYK